MSAHILMALASLVYVCSSQVASSLLIVITNAVMTFLVGVLVNFESHWTESRRERSIAMKSFVLETFNTAFITVIVYGYIAGNRKARARHPLLLSRQWKFVRRAENR